MKCFLLTDIKSLNLEVMKGEYSEVDDVVISAETKIPLASSHAIVTGSKTLSAPGDDDPDPETEICY